MTKTMWLGVGAIAAVGWCWTASAQQAYTPGAYTTEAATYGARPLVTNFQEQQTGPTVLTVVDPQTRALAVYHISRETGEIKLKSVRNIELDLRLPDYNGSSPKPDEIKRMFDLQQ